MNNKIFDEIEDLVLYYATDDYDYKKSVALFNVGKIEKMVDYCRYLQHQLEEKAKENQQLKEMQCPFLGTGCKRELEQLKQQKDDAVEYIKKHFQDDEGIICKYVGDNACETNENFIDELLRMLGEIDE